MRDAVETDPAIRARQAMDSSERHEMTDVAKRRVTILDIMTLVAVVAISIAWLRFMLLFQNSPPFPWREVASVYIGSRWVISITMLALIPLRLRHPRPSVSRLWRQPGWLACNAVALTLVITLVQYIPYAVLILQYPDEVRKAQSLNGFLVSLSADLGEGAGVAIAASWATLALVGGWESEKVWIDRAGRVCGLLLVIDPIFGLLLSIVEG